MLGASQEAEVGGYRSHTSAAPHYGGQYSSVYGSTSLSGAQQVSDFNLIIYISKIFPPRSLIRRSGKALVIH